MYSRVAFAEAWPQVRLRLRLSYLYLAFLSHEKRSIVSVDLVADDLAGVVALPDSTGAPRSRYAIASFEFENGCGVRTVEGLELTPPAFTRAPVDVKRSDPVDLNDRGFGRVAEHDASLRYEGVAPRPHLTELCTIELIADGEIDGALHDRDVFVDRMAVRRDDAAGELAYTDDEWLSNLSGIAVKNFDVAGHRPEWEYARLRAYHVYRGDEHGRDDRDKDELVCDFLRHYFIARFESLLPYR